MQIDYDALAYEMPWRPNYELKAIFCWLGAAATTPIVMAASDLPTTPFIGMSAICLAMASVRMPAAYKLAILQKHLRGKPLEFLNFKDLQKTLKKHETDLWLGKGFNWEQRHTQRVYEILKRDWSQVVGDNGGEEIGQPWIHGVETKEVDISQPLKHVEGHTLIVGTTGSGKTRMFDILISQAIARGETCFIIDPKGDKELAENAKRACLATGRPDAFLNFNPAFPEDSARIDLLANFSRVTEIASRIAALIPSETGGNPFTAFGWQAINNIAQALVITHEKPTLTKLRRFLESGTDGLVIKTIAAYTESVHNDLDSLDVEFDASAGPDLRKRAIAAIHFYTREIQPTWPSSELDGIISMFTHDGTHFSKMVANLMPIMNMLTSGILGPLLSPDPNDYDDTRTITNNAKIINNNQVAYIGLDSLTDGTVGSAIGSMYLSDLTSVAGDRYNYGIENKRVNIFVDEAAEVINDPFIQLLNKGRGANLCLYVATQTLSDFVARLGSKDKAYQVLGNINNLISLRTKDTETQNYIVENMPLTEIKKVERGQSQSVDPDEPSGHRGGLTERLVSEEATMFPAQMLGMLPNLHYVANISGGRIVKGRLGILGDN